MHLFLEANPEMNKDLFEYYNDLDDNDLSEGLYIDPRSSRVLIRGRLRKKLEKEEQSFIEAQDSSRTTFQFTYQAARFESWWLLESLNEFYKDHWITDVLRRVKGGKEASVYQCRGGPAIGTPLAAAKVYRPRSLRNLRNDHVYRQGRADLDGEGRVILDERMLHAMRKKTQYGKELLHQSWVAYEFTSLQALHAAGADVPEPFHMANNAILMEFIGREGASAPALSEIRLGGSEARALFDRTLLNIQILLQHEKIHGDLSAYNILYQDGRISLIDFPQVVSPRINQNAFQIFLRDVERVCAYFRQQGVRANASRLAEEIWVSQGYSIPGKSPGDPE